MPHYLIPLMVKVATIIGLGANQAATNSFPMNYFYPFHFPSFNQQSTSTSIQPSVSSRTYLNTNFANLFLQSTDYSPLFYSSYQQFPSFYYDQLPFGSYFPPHQTNFELPATIQTYEKKFYSKGTIRACPPARILNPCSCLVRRVQFFLPMGTIVCPEKTSAATAQAIFSNLRAGFRIYSVTLNLPQGAAIADYIPTIFKINYPAAVISAIYPTPPPPSCGLGGVLLSPCTCNPNNVGTVGTITCPAGATLTQIQTVFANIPPNTNLGNVVLNIPTEATVLPANLLGTNAASTIQLIGSNARTLSQLTIDVNAFATSSSTCSSFIIEKFDVRYLDYSFLTGFNVLKNVLLNQCTNTPDSANPPKNIPIFQKLVLILVDGVVYNSQCPDAALLAPCKCAIRKGEQVVTTICPEGSIMFDIMNAFSNFPENSNLGNVIIHFPSAKEMTVPAVILGDNSATTIKLIGPLNNPLSTIQITDTAFQALFVYTLGKISPVTEIFTIENFDVQNIDYSFLDFFKYLTTIEINKCTNAPTKANPPKNLPGKTTLPNLRTVSVDGTNIYSPGKRR